jgi:hypothetical protein
VTREMAEDNPTIGGPRRDRPHQSNATSFALKVA